MRIEAIDAVQDPLEGMSYLELMGISNRFTRNTVDDDSSDRFRSENKGGQVAVAQGTSGYQTVSVDKSSRSKRRDRTRNMDISELLKLVNVGKNKFFILMLLGRPNLIQLLFLLTKDQMVNAMYLFPKSMLLRFLSNLPKEMMLKLILMVMPLEKFLKFFTTKALFMMLSSKRLDVNSLVDGLDKLSEEPLKRLFASVTGQSGDKVKKKEMIAMFREMDKELLMEGIRSMELKFFHQLCTSLVQRDPELMMNLPRGEITQVLGRMTKPMLAGMFEHLPEDILLQCLTLLPDRELTIAVSQIDDNLFSYVLASKFPDLLQSLAADAA